MSCVDVYIFVVEFQIHWTIPYVQTTTVTKAKGTQPARRFPLLGRKSQTSARRLRHVFEICLSEFSAIIRERNKDGLLFVMQSADQLPIYMCETIKTACSAACLDLFTWSEKDPCIMSTEKCLWIQANRYVLIARIIDCCWAKLEN